MFGFKAERMGIGRRKEKVKRGEWLIVLEFMHVIGAALDNPVNIVNRNNTENY